VESSWELVGDQRCVRIDTIGIAMLGVEIRGVEEVGLKPILEMLAVEMVGMETITRPPRPVRIHGEIEVNGLATWWRVRDRGGRG
jgi:hypothetical protein